MSDTHIKQVNSYEFDERFYQQVQDDNEIVFVPSVTYILSVAYPTSKGLVKWIGDVGTDRAQEIKSQAAKEGSFVHEKIEHILKGGSVSSEAIQRQFSPRASLRIKRCLKSFLDWFKEYQPDVLETEYTVWEDRRKYAGTLDLKCVIDDEVWLIDFKTSKSVHDSHKIQLAAYNFADNGLTHNAAILHLGNKTKQKYSFLPLRKEHEKYKTERDFWLLFVHANRIFQIKNPNARPTRETFPSKFTIEEDNEESD